MNTLLLTDLDTVMTFLQSESFISALKSLGLAILVWIIGSMVIGRMTSFLTNYMEKVKMDESLRPFLSSLVSVLMKVMLLLAVASTLGMEVTSFVAIFSAAAFAVGMALQGGLSNFAGGVMILLFKPFKVNDVISAQGFTGKVKEIQIFNTILLSPDNKTIILPNGPLSNGSIENLTMQDKRRVDLTFGIGYDDDIAKAREVIYKVLGECPHVIDPENTDVIVVELAGSSVNFAVRPWTETANYWAVFAYMQENIKLQFDAHDIGIPYETMDINVNNAS